jgi:hypothetical protein
VQNRGGAVGFASPWAPPPQKDFKTAPAETFAGYTRPAIVDLRVGKSSISAEARAK